MITKDIIFAVLGGSYYHLNYYGLSYIQGVHCDMLESKCIF